MSYSKSLHIQKNSSAQSKLSHIFYIFLHIKNLTCFHLKICFLKQHEMPRVFQFYVSANNNLSANMSAVSLSTCYSNGKEKGRANEPLDPLSKKNKMKQNKTNKKGVKKRCVFLFLLSQLPCGFREIILIKM